MIDKTKVYKEHGHKVRLIVDGEERDVTQLKSCLEKITLMTNKEKENGKESKRDKRPSSFRKKSNQKT